VINKINEIRRSKQEIDVKPGIQYSNGFKAYRTKDKTY